MILREFGGDFLKQKHEIITERILDEDRNSLRQKIRITERILDEDKKSLRQVVDK